MIIMTVIPILLEVTSMVSFYWSNFLLSCLVITSDCWFLLYSEAYIDFEVVDIQFAFNLANLMKLDKQRSVLVFMKIDIYRIIIV